MQMPVLMSADETRALIARMERNLPDLEQLSHSLTRLAAVAAKHRSGNMRRPDTLDQPTVRALCEAGYLTLREYLEIAAARGWGPDPAFADRAAQLAGPAISTEDPFA